MRDVNKLLKLDPGNTELLAQKQKLLSTAVENTSSKLKTLESAQEQVNRQFAEGKIDESQYMAFNREVEATKASLGRLDSGLQATESQMKGSSTAAGMAEAGYSKAAIKAAELSGDIEKAGNSANEASSGFDKSADAAKNLDDHLDTIEHATVGEAMQGIAGKAAEMGGAVLETGIGFANAQSQMQSSMGMTASEASKATESVKSVFKSGLVDSVDDATDAVMTVKNAFSDLNGADLTHVTTQLQAIANHSGVDLVDVTNAASQAMKGFGTSGKNATDMVAKGLQDGLNKNGDFLDTVNEYSPTFKDAGMSAGNMLNVLSAGMKAGAFNTDKVADAVKEFQLRLTSGQLDEPMKSFGKATQDVFQKFKDGKATSAEVMAAVGKDLKGMPADKAKAAVQGLGTQFEDLGTGSSAALLQAATGTEKVSGAADELSKKTPGEKLKESLNTLKGALADLLTKMTPVINVVTDLVKAFANAPGPIQTIIGVIGAVMAILAVLSPAITAIATVIGAFGAATLGPIAIAIGAVIAVIAAVIIAIQNWGKIVDWLKGIWSAITGFFSNLWAGIQQVFSTALQAIQTAITTVWTAITTTTSTIWNGIKTVVSTVWNGIKSVVSSVASAVGGAVSNAWNVIKSATSSVFNAVKSVASSVWNGIKSTVTSVVNGIKSTVSSVWNAIKSATSSAFNAVKSTASSVWNSIKSTVSGVVNAIKSVVSGAWNGVKSATSSAFNGVKNTISSVMNAAHSVVSGIVSKIKSLFNFHLKFPSISIPHIPLPHFHLSGSFNPLKGKIPSVGISWYAKGGIFTKPTLFANPNGGYSGVGEAGPEAAIPLNAKTLAGIGKGIAEATGDLGGVNVTVQVLADTSSQTIKKIKDAVVDGITKTQDSKKRALGGA